MNMLKIKTMLAAVFGTGGSTLSWMASAATHGLLSNLLLILGGIPIVVSVYYMRKINLHKEHITAIAESRAQRELCEECKLGKRPIKCPIERSNRPECWLFFEDPQKHRIPFYRFKDRLRDWIKKKEETTK